MRNNTKYTFLFSLIDFFRYNGYIFYDKVYNGYGPYVRYPQRTTIPINYSLKNQYISLLKYYYEK